MAKRRRRRFKLDEVDLDLTPMIDIVFQLLIFFMCATKFRTPEGLIEAYLPKNRGQSSGTPQIDQVQIHAIETSTAEISPTEVRLADLLGTEEGLILKLIAVETRPAALARDGAIDQPAA